MEHRVQQLVLERLVIRCPAPFAVLPRRRALEQIEAGLKVCPRTVSIDVLRVIGPVLGELEYVAAGTLQLGVQPPFHLGILPERQESVAAAPAERGREIFPILKSLVPPNVEVIGVVCAPHKVCYPVERIVLPVCLHNLAQVTAHKLIFEVLRLSRQHGAGHAHPGGIDVRPQGLASLLAQPVEIPPSACGVRAYLLKLQSEVIIEPVRGDAGLLGRETLLVHLERSGQVLALPHHRYRDVSHQDNAFKRMAAASELEDFGLDLRRLGPCAADNHGIKTLAMEHVPISVQLIPACAVCGGVNDDSECVVR